MAAGTLTATVDDGDTGGTQIQAAEYYLDSVAGAPTGVLDPVDAAFDSPAEDVTGTVCMSPGEHILYVRGQDALGNWGEFSSVLVNGDDIVGPATSGPRLHRNPANGAADVAIHATGDDTVSGGSNISAAEYFFGPDVDPSPVNGCGSRPRIGYPLTVNKIAVIASLDGTSPRQPLTALPEGKQIVSIRSQDAAGTWGAPAMITLVVDKTGPDATGMTVAPNPNNGTIPFSASIPAVRVEGLFTDPLSGGVNSTLRKAEGFIDTVGSNNQGIKFGATDGVFDSTSELGYTDIPLATIQQLSNGTHTIYVHAQDKARNWGQMAEIELMIDKAGPTVTNVTADPNPTVGSGTVALTATATDALSPIGAAEWWTGVNPGTGNGTPMTVSGSDLSATIDVSGWPAGEYRIRVRAQDSLGNWGRRSSTLLVVS